MSLNSFIFQVLSNPRKANKLRTQHFLLTQLISPRRELISGISEIVSSFCEVSKHYGCSNCTVVVPKYPEKKLTILQYQLLPLINNAISRSIDHSFVTQNYAKQLSDMLSVLTVGHTLKQWESDQH
jgi:hypothetical protein